MSGRERSAQLIGILLAGLLAGCSSGDVTSGQEYLVPTAVPLALPAPGSLQHRVSYDDALQWRFGADFDGLLPSALTAPAGTAATFSPNWAPPAGATFAYGIYSFALPGYDEEPVVYFDWDTAPASSNLWLALADWDADRWELFDVPSLALRGVGELTPYLRSGDGALLAAVIVLGTAPAQLAALQVGSALPPEVPEITNVAPRNGVSGADVTFTATVTGTAPLTYAWDFGGGAAPNTSAAVAPLVTLGATATYSASLTVSSPWGADTLDFTLNVLDEIASDWDTAWYLNSSDSVHQVCVDSADNLYIAGVNDNLLFQSQVLLVKLGKDGSFKWAATWHPRNYNVHETGVAVDSVGNIWVCGWCDNLGGATLDFALKYDVVGALVVEKMWEGGSGKFVRCATDAGDNLYCVGDEFIGEVIKSHLDGLVVKFDSSGNVLWQKNFDLGDLDSFRGCEQSAGKLLVCGLGLPTGRTQLDGQLLRLSADGVIEWSSAFGEDSYSEQFLDVAVQPLSDALVVCGLRSGTTAEGIFAGIDALGTLDFAAQLDGGAYDTYRNIAWRSSGSFLASGEQEFGGLSRTCYVELDSTGSWLGTWSMGMGGSSAAGAVGIAGDGATLLLGSAQTEGSFAIAKLSDQPTALTWDTVPVTWTVADSSGQLVTPQTIVDSPVGEQNPANAEQSVLAARVALLP